MDRQHFRCISSWNVFRCIVKEFHIARRTCRASSSCTTCCAVAWREWYEQSINGWEGERENNTQIEITERCCWFTTTGGEKSLDLTFYFSKKKKKRNEYLCMLELIPLWIVVVFVSTFVRIFFCSRWAPNRRGGVRGKGY